jgi:hypothetical protein
MLVGTQPRAVGFTHCALFLFVFAAGPKATAFPHKVAPKEQLSQLTYVLLI